ncbi:hypothetical protein TNCV_1026491 [Trichonephila clavipes]|nr:hypothetical protein TNCV_1026491 [Trichonephila clavipes]
MVEDDSETKDQDSLNEDVTVPPKIKHNMLRCKDNYNLVLQDFNRKYPNSINKLTGQYIRILASTTDEHQEITSLLKSKGEEFYTVPPLALTDHSKWVATPKHNTQKRTKLAIFQNLAERRPIRQFHQEHITGAYPIKECLDTPHCINCNSDGHTANWRSCPAFPKIKTKKGAATENRNKNTPKPFTSKLANANLSYANATSNQQQMTALVERTELAKNNNYKSDSNKKEENPSPQGFISAMAEFRKFFQSFQNC